MGNFAIMRWGKIKFDGVSNAEYHQRTELHKNCEHPELREQNFTFRQFEDETLRQTTKRLMAAQQERTGRRVRNDATVMVDFVLTFSPEMVGKIDMGAWFKANVDWLHQEFGAKNLLRLDMHFHESSPHLHAFISPLDEKGNFNFKKHVKQISAMQEQLQQLPEITESQQKALRELQRLHQQVESKKGTKKKLDAQVEDLQKDVAHLTGEKHALTTESKDLRKATEEEKIRYLNLKADSEKLSGEIAKKRRELTEYVFSDRNSVPEVPRGTLHLGEADDILDL